MSASKEIEYSDKYADSQYEYRHVILPKEVMKQLPNGKLTRLLTENEWRSLGVQQSRGWVHYDIHKPEIHILLFRRPLGTDPITGKIVNVSNPVVAAPANPMPLQPVQQQQTLSLQPQAMKKLAAK